MSLIRFEVGNTYQARSACDHDCVWEFTVVARTAKFVTITDGDKTWRVGTRMWEGVERCSPLGTYSMAPVLVADRPTRALRLVRGGATS